MSSPLFQIEIITPKRVLYQNHILAAFIPGILGNFEILNGHAPLISSMAIGEIRVREEDGYEVAFAAGGGFAEVHDNKVLIFAETCEKASDIDINRAKQTNERILQNMIDRASYDPDQMLQAIRRSINRIRIATKYTEQHHR